MVAHPQVGPWGFKPALLPLIPSAWVGVLAAVRAALIFLFPGHLLLPSSSQHMCYALNYSNLGFGCLSYTVQARAFF